MAGDRVLLLTPVGRLVQGGPWEGRTKDFEGRPLTTQAGQPRTDWFMGLAIRKDDPGWLALWAEIVGVARRDFPTLFDAAGNCNNPRFAFKYTDGDSAVPNQRGSKPCDRDGFPGHHVLGFSSGFAPECFTANGAAKLIDPESIKRGYYIRISGNVVGNDKQAQPGVYLGARMVELIGYGEEIASGPQGDVVFGGNPVTGALPPGCSATPLAPAGPPLAQPGQPPATPAVAPMPPVAPPPGVAPAPDFLNPPGGVAAQPATAGTPPPVAAPPTAPPPAALAVPPVGPLAAPPTAPVAAAGLSRQYQGRVFTDVALVAAGFTADQINALPVA